MLLYSDQDTVVQHPNCEEFKIKIKAQSLITGQSTIKVYSREQKWGREGGGAEGRREQRQEPRRGHSFSINTDDTFIQAAHQRPSSHPVIKHYAALRTHALWAPVPGFLESPRLFSSSLRWVFFPKWSISRTFKCDRVGRSAHLEGKLGYCRTRPATAALDLASPDSYGMSFCHRQKYNICLFVSAGTGRVKWRVAILETAVGTDDWQQWGGESDDYNLKGMPSRMTKI